MTNRLWTEEEERLLIDHYNSMPIGELMRKLDRSMDSIRIRAGGLKLTTRPDAWSEEEVDYLRSNYGPMSAANIAAELGRTVRSVALKVFTLRIGRGEQVNLSPLDKGIPYMSASKSGEYRALLIAMDVGDSFEFPTAERQTVLNQMIYFPDRVFRTKKNSDTTRRLWRVV